MFDLQNSLPNSQYNSVNATEAAFKLEGREEREGKTFVSYRANLEGRSFKVTVGFSKEGLRQHCAGGIPDEPGLLGVIDKIVNGMSAQDLILLTGKSVSANLAKPEETKIHDLSTKEIQTLEEIREFEEKKELVETVNKVVNAFQISEMGKIIEKSVEDVNHGPTASGLKGDAHHITSGSDDNGTEGKIKEVAQTICKPVVDISIEETVEKITKAAERPNLSGAGNKGKENRFKNIEKEWTGTDGKYDYSITEKIDRIDTADRMKEIAKAELEYLNTLDEPDPQVTARKELLSKTINHDHSDRWAGSDNFRDMLRGKKELNSRIVGIKEAVENYTRIVEEQYYTRPLPVNMRYHSCGTYSKNEIAEDSDMIELKEIEGGHTNEIKTEGWLRAGVISCLDNGFVNQKKMEGMRKALEDNDLDKANTLRNEMANEIIKVWKKNFKNNSKIDATAGYALTQLGYSLDEVQEIGRNVHHTRNYRLTSEISNENVNRVKAKVNEAVKKREDLLASQFLQLVMEQVNQSGPEDLADGLRMIHVGLLNGESLSVDKGTGWYHNEENQMLDMAHIMGEFNNKEIVFDGGPYIDRLGNIHLPKPDGYAGEDAIRLNSVFINTSVQGHTANDGVQLGLNLDALEEVRGFDASLANDLEGLIGRDGAESNYAIAANVIKTIRKKCKVSTGCLSAKDRTGGVSLLVTDSIMEDSGCPKEMRAQVRREQLVSPDSPAVQVVQDCTKTKAMKIATSGYDAVLGEQKPIDWVGAVIKVIASTVWEAGVKERLRIQKKEQSDANNT